MASPITIVDAFTDQPFSGNPAGIVQLAAPASEAWMQAVAAEVNLAETAFLVPRADGDHDLRWFTPTVEVDLCGHATLASAHVLGGTRRFHTRSGVLTCEVSADGTITLDLPATTVEPLGTDGWDGALSLPAGQVVAAGEGGGWSLVEVAAAEDVERAAPVRDVLLALGGHAIVVADTTADDTIAFDSVCRTFVPAAGIDEDPVTGSAHCLIAPWLGARTGRTAFLGRQASPRGGTVGMEVRGDRVILAGTAVTVSTGSLLVEPA
ncbi:PhzF family phenazine biosynthesis protein [Aquihabitans daechungensis]|uniref:PhzF family phenazine biosynthesis protein n=1 Tax=Aquihabitans daechungensis TaxID=1052257 RepID=UPI003BA1BCA3